MYSLRMRSGSRFIFAFACVSFLTITLSGIHLHADVGGHGEFVSHAQDLHLASFDDFDDDHVDISIFEPATGVSKVETLAPCLGVPELAALPPLVNHWSTDAPNLTPRRHLRWQPPVRAPPLSA